MERLLKYPVWFALIIAIIAVMAAFAALELWVAYEPRLAPLPLLLGSVAAFILYRVWRREPSPPPDRALRYPVWFALIIAIVAVLTAMAALRVWTGYDPLLATLPAAIGLGICGVIYLFWPRVRIGPPIGIPRPSLPQDTVEIRFETKALEFVAPTRLMLILVGSFGCNLGRSLLIQLERSNLEKAVGSILLVELHDQRREKVIQEIPGIYRDRLVAVSVPALPEGLGNRSPNEVKDLIDTWGPPIQSASLEVCDRHQRLNKDNEASLVLTFLSLGGSATLATQVVRHVKSKFRQAEVYGFCALPEDSRLRERAPEILGEYTTVGVHGFVVSDNQLDPVINDRGMVEAIVGLISGAEIADTPKDINNALKLLFPLAPGGYVTYKVLRDTIPGFPLPERWPQLYYVYRGAVVASTSKLLAQIDDRGVKALEAELDRSDGVRYDIVNVALLPEGARHVGDEVKAGVGMRKSLGLSGGSAVPIFASVATEIDSNEPVCPVLVTSLAPVKDGASMLAKTCAPSSQPPPNSGQT